MLWGSQQSTLSYGAAMEYYYCCKLEISMKRQWLPCVNSMQMLLEKPFQVAMQKHVHNSTESPAFFWAALRMTMHRDANTFWTSGTLQGQSSSMIHRCPGSHFATITYQVWGTLHSVLRRLTSARNAPCSCASRWQRCVRVQRRSTIRAFLLVALASARQPLLYRQMQK